MLKFTAEFSELRKVRIPIETDYKWGEGYTDLSQRYLFENEVFSKLRRAGYRINNNETSSSCATIDYPDGTYLYLHPMEFTGYLSKEDTDTIVDILRNCKSVKKVGEVKIEQVYNLTDYQYEKILEDNLPFITEWIDKNPFKDEFDFVREYRVPRVGDKSGMSANDRDVRFIRDVIVVKKYYDKVAKQKTQKILDIGNDYINDKVASMYEAKAMPFADAQEYAQILKTETSVLSGLMKCIEDYVEEMED